MSFLNANVLIQQFVDKYGNTDRTYRAIDFVRDLSNANTSITAPEFSSTAFLQAPGKLRSLRLNYFPILCNQEGSCSTTICDAGVVKEPAQVVFDIEECTASPIYAINKNDIRLVDNGRWDFSNTAMNIIASAMPDMRRQLATDFVTKLYSMTGVHLDGSAEKKVAPINTQNGIVNPIGMFQIQREFLDGGFMKPYILGGGDVYYWDKMVEIGGLNYQGQRIDQLNRDNTYYDDGLSSLILNDTVNGDHILAITPEVFKFVTYSENAGIFRTGMASLADLPNLYRNNFAGFLEGTMIDPVTGLLWDLYIRYDECNSRWTFQIKLRWDFFILPDVACNTQGVNGAMHYRTCPETVVQCPAGSPLPSPAAATTFSWTPVLANIPVISQSTIGGVNMIENTPVAINTVTELVAYMNTVYSPGNPIFTVSGSNVHYLGYSEIAGSFNNGDYSFTFA